MIAGGGGREHALAWHLAKSPHVEEIYGASKPGNVGIAEIGTTVPVNHTDIPELLKAAKNLKIDFAIASMDNSLEAGLVDAFERADIPIFGPTQEAAKLEWSKAWASEFMRRHNVPTADFRNFYDYYSAKKYLKALGWQNAVIKADGLCLGKGVDGPTSYEEAEQALYANFIKKRFGKAGEITQIQNMLYGEELSVFAISDGENFVMLPFFRDYKRLYDGNKIPNPNTGGIASYGPISIDSETSDALVTQIVRPTVEGMAEERRTFRGVLYFGVMLTPDGPKVFEINTRFGNPEMQPMAVMLGEDMYPIMRQAAEGKLKQKEINILPGNAVSITLCSKGYAIEGKKLDTEHEIYGLNEYYEGVEIFHAGTGSVGDKVVNIGGRVLDVVGYADNLPDARERTLKAIGKNAIHFKNMHHRTQVALAS